MDSINKELLISDSKSDISEIEHIEKTEDMINRNLYIKVQNVIRNAKIQKYAKEGNQISKKGISFFGGLTGANELQLEKIKNVKLRIELLQSQKIEDKNQYESKDMMADLYACAISELGGNFTPEMKKLYDKIKIEYANEEISEESIYKLACEKIVDGQSYLPIIHKEKTKGIFGDTKIQIEFYKLENKRLENEIILERGKSQFKTFNYVGKKVGVIIPTNVKNTKKCLTNA